MTAHEPDGCRATLVVHLDGLVTCLDDDCVTVEELHLWVLPCAEVDPACCGPGGEPSA